MNLHRLSVLADRIEAGVPGIGFNMLHYVSERRPHPKRGYTGSPERIIDHSGNDCGTVACIAGHAYLAFVGPVVGVRPYKISADAATALGLTVQEAFDLFSALNADSIGTSFCAARSGLHTVLQSEAVNTLRHAAVYGVIDWAAANKPQISELKDSP